MSTQDGVVEGVADTGSTIFNSLGGFFNSIQEGVGQYGLKIVGGIVALIIGLWIVNKSIIIYFNSRYRRYTYCYFCSIISCSWFSNWWSV